MTTTSARNLISLAIALLFLLFASPHSLADNTQEEVDFVKHIKPVLEMHCIRCHGPEKAESFRIDEKDSALNFVDEGASEDSDLYLALVSDDEEQLMPPPEEKDPLTAEQIAFVKTWIDEGANWPEDVELADKYVSKDMEDKDDEKRWSRRSKNPTSFQCDRFLASGRHPFANRFAACCRFVCILQLAWQFCNERLCILLLVAGNAGSHRRLCVWLVVQSHGEPR